jgi:hypothetical protein
MQETEEVVESPQEQQQDFSDVATDALRDALGTETNNEVMSPEIEETPSQESESEPIGEVSDQTEEGYTEIVETNEAEEEAERLAKRRVRPRNELDQQVIDLYRSSGFEGTFQDASAIIFGGGQNTQLQQPAQVQQPSEPEVDPYEAHVNELKESVVSLESQIAEATEDMDTAKAIQLQRDLFRKELEMNNLQTQRQIQEDNQVRSAQESQRQRALESRNTAVEKYPELGEKQSVYRKEFDHFISNAEQDPDYAAVFSSPRWPEIMANEFASIKGAVQSQPTVQQPQQPAPQQAPVMGNQAKVLTTGQTAKPANQPISKEQVLNNVGSLSNEQLFQMLGQPDGRKFLR